MIVLFLLFIVIYSILISSLHTSKTHTLFITKGVPTDKILPDMRHIYDNLSAKTAHFHTPAATSARSPTRFLHHFQLIFSDDRFRQNPFQTPIFRYCRKSDFYLSLHPIMRRLNESITHASNISHSMKAQVTREMLEAELW